MQLYASAIPPRRSASTPSSRRRTAQYHYPGTRAQTRTRRRGSCLLFALGGGLLGLLLILALAFFVLPPLLTSHATVTLLPRSQMVQSQLSLPAAQAHVSQISVTAAPQSASAPATGTLPATRAQGILNFLNQTTADVTLAGGVITDKHGIQIQFTGPLLVSATQNNASATTTGTAVLPGASGDIPRLDMTMPCCVSGGGIVVENTTAFSGGADARPDDLVQQSDIDQAAQSLIASQKTQEQAQLATQLQSNEQIIPGTLACSPRVTSDVPAGKQAARFTVTVAVSFGEEVYDATAAQAAATSLLGPQAPAGYVLSGQVALSAPMLVNPTTLQVQAQGRWLYHFSQTQLGQFALLIAGQSQARALTLLRQQNGVADAHIAGPTTLPAASAIQFQIQTS